MSKLEIEPWDPWREFERVREEIDAILSRFLARVREVERERPIAFFPATDVIETSQDLRAFISLPGVVEEDIEIAVEEGVLVVRGERECPYDQERNPSRLAEWRYGYFERRIPLPEGLDPEGLSASHRWGVLSIVIPRRAAGG